MKKILLLLAAVAAAGLVLGTRWRARHLVALAAAAESSPSPAPSLDLQNLVPGPALDPLSAAQRQVLAQVLGEGLCYCGCPHTLAGCLRGHKSCRHAPRMATVAARLAGTGLAAEEISQLLSEYYASFEKRKRARFDTKESGPALGSPKATISLVEFSDFGCPYCQMLRPELEQFIESHKDRVKLFYKPFPLQGHEHSLEAAEAVEWARDKRFFWKLNEVLFAHSHALDPNDLVSYVEQLGGDGADLRKALETHRNQARIEAGMSEARAAGLTATPTLFFNGRRLTLPDLTPAGLELTLEDEEEWQKNGGGWTRD